jgi:uncharacterized protein YggE
MRIGTDGRRAMLATALAALLALALLASTAHAAERIVSVGATATLKVPNDTAKIGVAVSRERKTRAAALRAASAGLGSVIAAVQKVSGVGEGDVKTGRINVNAVTRGKVTIYRAAEGAGVTLHEPANAGTLVQKALAAGATNVSGPTYSVGDTEAAFARVLVLAFDKAKGRAQSLAAAAGATLGPAVAIEEGEGAELLPFAADKAAGGEEGSSEACAVAPVRGGTARSSACAPAPPTKPGKSQVRATVHVVFELR